MSVSSITYFEQEGKDSFLWIIIREESGWERIGIESFCIADTFRITEANESTLSVISTISTISNSSKGKIMIEHMHNNIIDYKTSRRSVIFDILNIFLILTAHVDHQRLWFSPYFFDKFIEFGVRMYRKDRSKYLLLHYWTVHPWLLHYCWRKMQLFMNYLTSIKSLSSVIFEQPLQLLQMIYIVYLTIISWVYTVLIIKCLLYLLHQNLLELIIHLLIYI